MRPVIVDWLAPHLGESWAAALAPGWFTFIGLAALACGIAALVCARRAGADVDRVMRTVAWGYVFALLGGIAGPALFDAASRLASGGSPHLRWAGMTSWAGFAAGAAAIAYVWRRDDRTGSLASLADLLAIPMAVALVVARLGCFVAGCDFGKVTSGPWAVRFPEGSSAWRHHVHEGWLPATRAESLPVHPTQLYEALLGLLLVALALLIGRSAWGKARAGRVACSVVLGYAAGRWVIENLRGDVGRGFLGPLSTGQAYTIVVVALAAWALWRIRHRAPAVAACAALLLSLAATPSLAQPVAPDPQTDEPVKPAPPQPDPPHPIEPAPEPVDPYADSQPEPPPAEQATGFEIAGFLGFAAAMNRRDEQIPQLGGLSLAGTLDVGHGVGVGIQLDSLASDVASHRSFMVAGELRKSFGDRLAFGARLGLGFTRVDFADAAFRDQLASGFRVGANVEYAIAENWALELWPMTFDVTGGADLGGPITTYQMRFGISYRSRRLSSMGGGGVSAPAPTSSARASR